MKYLRYPLYFLVGFFGASLVAGITYRALTVTPNKILEKVRPSMVTLRNPDNPDGGGTGFAVTAPSGATFILTNAHICEMTDKDYVLAKLADTDKARYARVRPIEITHETDLCLAEANSVPGLVPLKVAEATNALREHVYIVGYPRLNPLTVTEGHYSGTNWIEVQYCAGIRVNGVPRAILPMSSKNPNYARMQIEFDFMRCLRSLWAVTSTAPAAPGNSGSPTLNEAGEVVGVLFAGSGRGESFHVPLSEVQKFLSKY